jgi:hypothetical protein
MRLYTLGPWGEGRCRLFHALTKRKHSWMEFWLKSDVAGSGTADKLLVVALGVWRSGLREDLIQFPTWLCQFRQKFLGPSHSSSRLVERKE